MKPVPVKRLLLLTVLAFGSAFAVHAQEAPAGGASLQEQPEPSAALKWGNFIVLAAPARIFDWQELCPGAYIAARTEGIQKDITEAQAIKKDAEDDAGPQWTRVCGRSASEDGQASDAVEGGDAAGSRAHSPGNGAADRST